MVETEINFYQFPWLIAREGSLTLAGMKYSGLLSFAWSLCYKSSPYMQKKRKILPKFRHVIMWWSMIPHWGSETGELGDFWKGRLDFKSNQFHASESITPSWMGYMNLGLHRVLINKDCRSSNRFMDILHPEWWICQTPFTFGTELTHVVCDYKRGSDW
jgi:hypothetical protein